MPVGHVPTLSHLWTVFFLCYVQNVITLPLPALGVDSSPMSFTVTSDTLPSLVALALTFPFLPFSVRL